MKACARPEFPRRDRDPSRAKGGFPPTATSAVANFPGGAVRPTLRHATAIPASAPSGHLRRASTPSGRSDYAVRGPAEPTRLEAACRPPTRISSGALEGSQTILRSVGHHFLRTFSNPSVAGFRLSTTSILEPDQRLRRRLGSFEPRPRKASLPSDVLEITRRIGIPRWG
jgi:hypothetical protein